MRLCGLPKDRAPLIALALGVAIAAGYVGDRLGRNQPAALPVQRLLTVRPWHCEVYDPEGRGVVASSVETFHEGGALDGTTRLEDRRAGRVLAEFSYRGVWQFNDPWLTEAIEEYRYLKVDGDAFSPDDLSAIEAEFGEPEVSRVHALTDAELVYGDYQSLYQCHRRSGEA